MLLRWKVISFLFFSPLLKFGFLPICGAVREKIKKGEDCPLAKKGYFRSVCLLFFEVGDYLLAYEVDGLSGVGTYG